MLISQWKLWVDIMITLNAIFVHLHIGIYLLSDIYAMKNCLLVVFYNFGYALAQGSHKRHFLSAQLTYALLQEDYDWLWLVMGLEGFPFVFSYSMVVKFCYNMCLYLQGQRAETCIKLLQGLNPLLAVVLHPILLCLFI